MLLATLDVEASLGNVEDDHVHIFVVDVDRGSWTATSLDLGYPIHWLLHVYFEFHDDARLRIKLASGIGETWARDGGIPQGCPLSMVVVALCLPWCNCLVSIGRVKHQLYADTPRSFAHGCSYLYRLFSYCWSHRCPTKCVLLSTCPKIRREMKSWVIFVDGRHWKVLLDVRVLGGLIDTKLRWRGPLFLVGLSGEIGGMAAVENSSFGFLGEASDPTYQICFAWN